MIVLPWPDKRLSPNARLHWKARVGPRQDARRRAGWCAVTSQGFNALKEAVRANDGPIPVRITFYPPDGRHRDDDNMIASFKAARDGVAEALGVDDRRFKPHYFFEEPAKPGRVEMVFFPQIEVGVRLPQPVESANESGPETLLKQRPALTNRERTLRNGS